MQEGGGRRGRFIWRLCFLYVTLVTICNVHADANVGCLFSKTLCTENIEWCYDDNAFGKCLQTYGNIEEDDLYRFDLTTDELRAFEQELQHLLILGYRWSHSYTQCVLQGMLYAIQNNLHYDSTVCEHLVDQDLTAALGAFETDEQANPESVAVIRFTPNNQQNINDDDFANEVYIPTEQLSEDIISEDENYDNLNNIYNNKRSIDTVDDNNYQVFSRVYNTPGEFRNGHETKDLIPISNDDDYFSRQYFNTVPLSDENLLNLYDRNGGIDLGSLLQTNNRNNEQSLNDLNYLPEDWLNALQMRNLLAEPQNDRFYITEKFHQNYNTPAMFRQGYESRDDVDSDNNSPEIIEETIPDNIDEFQNDEISIPRSHPSEGFNNQWLNYYSPTAFTEGGPVYTGNSQNPDKTESQEMLKTLLADSELANFFRRKERLDVKKPGPLFDKHISQIKTKDANEESGAPIVYDKKDTKNQKLERKLGQHIVHFSENTYDPLVDDSFAFVAFKDSVYTWRDGAEVLKKIARALDSDESLFAYIRVEPNQVTFRVQENNLNLNASVVAIKIYEMKDKIKQDLGLEITSTGLGDKSKLPIRPISKGDLKAEKLSFENYRWYNSILLATCAATAAAAIGVATAMLYVRHRRRRLHKLNQLPEDTEASEDYQQLCRARMQTDWGTKSGEKGPAQQREGSTNRIASLSKDSDNNSPSTRSSTSSWSEEPALTNMDISTGHMVLTYMEDHLKNKDRLEQEWRALCAYEAEPSATTAAQQDDNADKNRTPGVLPYDHSRLVLSNIANQHNSDYINASTITDHDPRNPAYIAAQGPLEHTAADFWQMVWEQGSVVMVMLTRLNEGGTNMCHRYWPEEGADLYHIYEVHLVSEHIWCDDYLVRSFYLKNVKSGETRTVTQFHFLSWPDNSVPSSTKALLEFRRKVNKSYRGRSCPIIVHCSDGAGRTGTYCLIDMVLNRMAKGAKEIDIAATLEHIRDQRPHMVSTKQQFEFVLMAVAEEVHAILKALPAQLQQQHEKKEKESVSEKEK